MIPFKTIGRALELIAAILTNIVRFFFLRLFLLLEKGGMSPCDYKDRRWQLIGRFGRSVFEDMGATFIKLAQILSTRRDMFPEPTLEEFEKLQDDVPSFDGALVPPIFEREFGKTIDEVFASFDLKPVASASVAQVHRGVLKDGKEVALKVIRPGIEEKMIEDLKIIKFIVRAICLIPFVQLRSFVGFTDYFAEMIEKQLDLTIEAENNRKFQKIFKKDADTVRFPELFEVYCSKNIMAMEFVRGVKPTELNSEDFDIKRMAGLGFYMYYSMICHGLIHADLHPGNILVSPEGFFWVFDMGLVDEIIWEKRKNFFEAWFSIFNHDGGPLARLILKFSISYQIDDMEEFVADVTELCERHLAERIEDIEFGGIIIGLGGLQRKYKIVAQPTWTSIGVSIVSVEGLARHFDPELNVVQTISPHLKNFLRKIYLMDPKLKNKRSIKTG